MTARLSCSMLALLLLSSLGPYLPGGVRSDHIVSLVVMMYAIGIFLAGGKISRTVAWPLLMIAGAVAAMVTFDAFRGGPDDGPKVMYIAVFLRHFQPIEILFALAVLAPRLSEAHWRRLNGLIIKLSALAAVYSLVSVFVNVAAIQQFYVAGTIEESVWYQAYEIHRYTGFFNQPMEAGVYFSVALLLWLHRVLTTRHRTFGLMLCGALILAGGMLSLSKNFTVLGIAMAGYVALFHGRHRVFKIFAVSGGVVAAVGILLAVADSAYLASYAELYEQGGFFYALSAGRFGEGESNVKMLIARYLDQGFWTGFGMGSEQLFDSGYLEYFYQGGVLPGLLYIGFFVYFARYGWKRRRLLEGKMLLALSGYALLCSFGGAMLALNRANIPLIFALVFSLVASSRPVGKMTKSAPEAAPVIPAAG